MMHFKKTRDWLEVILWVGIIITLIVIGYSIWYNYVDLSIAALIIMLAMVFLLGYFKYTQVLSLKRKFVIVQETFTTLMLIYFSYNYFRHTDETPGQKVLDTTAKKFGEVYEKSRYHLAMPLILKGLKVFGEIKNIKNTIMSEVKDFSSSDGFNLDNAESITKQVGELVNKLSQLSDIVTQGFTSKKSIQDILDEKPDNKGKTGTNAKMGTSKTTAKASSVKTAAQSKTSQNSAARARTSVKTMGQSRPQKMKKIMRPMAQKVRKK